MPVLNPTGLVDNRVNAIRKLHEEVGNPKAQLDVSGGMDSAVILMLLARAVGPKNITAVYSSIHSSNDSRVQAQAVATAAGVRLCAVEATQVYEALVVAAKGAMQQAGFDADEIEDRIENDPTVLGSLRSCLRAPLGRVMNRMAGGGIRHGTGNEDEDRWLRFYQKGGDGEVDTNPVAMLSKGEVYQLAVALGVPREIIDCTPTPDLWGQADAHNDEQELEAISGVPWTYSRVDPTTGEYRCVGTIERVSRFADNEGAMLFGDGAIEIDAVRSYFPNDDDIKLRAWLESARKWEKMTRHKWNPNCPSLGSRTELVDLELVTNDLPNL